MIISQVSYRTNGPLVYHSVFQGDYNLVINDYVRAKTMFADTQIKIFQKGELVLSVIFIL